MLFDARNIFWSRCGHGLTFLNKVVTKANTQKKGKWRTWRDSNARPLASEANTLSS